MVLYAYYIYIIAYMFLKEKSFLFHINELITKVISGMKKSFFYKGNSVKARTTTGFLFVYKNKMDYDANSSYPGMKLYKISRGENVNGQEQNASN